MAAWYQDNTRKTYVATYMNERVMRAEIEAAAKFGWITQTMASSHKGQWTVSYIKDEQARVRIQAEDAFRQLGEQRSKLVQAVGKVHSLETDTRQRFHAVRMETGNPTQLEQKLLKTIKELVTARQAAITQRNVVIGAYGMLQSAHQEAEKLRVDVSHVKADFSSETATLRQEIATESGILQRERAIQEAQEAVVKPVQDWQRAIGDHWGTRSKGFKASQKLASIQQNPAAGEDGAPAIGLNTSAQAVQAEQAKHEEAIRTAEALVQQREAVLVERLKTRDAQLAVLVGK